MIYGLFEPTVIQCRRKIAPENFHGYIDITIWAALDDFASTYLDDILICSNLDDELVDHVKWVMQCLLRAALYWKQKRIQFHTETLGYLVLILLTKGMSMNEDEIETVRNSSYEKRLSIAG
jgi:hypothetical protein